MRPKLVVSRLKAIKKLWVSKLVNFSFSDFTNFSLIFRSDKVDIEQSEVNDEQIEEETKHDKKHHSSSGSSSKCSRSNNENHSGWVHLESRIT